MSLIGALFESRGAGPLENPGRPLTDPSLLAQLGGVPTYAGTTITEQNAIQTIAVFRAVSLLSGLVAGLPLKAYRYSDKTQVYPPALMPATYGATPFELWETVMVHLLLWGNAYLLKQRNGLSAVTGLIPIYPGRVDVKIVRDDAGHPDGKVFEIAQENGQPQPFTSYEILHIPALGYDGIKGLSPVAMARQSLGIYTAAEQTAARLFGNGTLMSGILTTDRELREDQADALKARWRQKLSGLGHSHDIAVLDSGTTFTPVSLPPEDAQFLETRRWQTVEIARWFGIPPHLLGDVEKSTSWGTGIEQQNIGFVAYTLRPWLNRIEQRVTREIVQPSTQYAEFLIDGLLRGDTAERYAAYSTGIQWGFITRNEARVKENLPPLDGLDEPLTPLNMSKGDEETPLAPSDVNAPTPKTDTALVA